MKIFISGSQENNQKSHALVWRGAIRPVISKRSEGIIKTDEVSLTSADEIECHLSPYGLFVALRPAIYEPLADRRVNPAVLHKLLNSDDRNNIGHNVSRLASEVYGYKDWGNQLDWLMIYRNWRSSWVLGGTCVKASYNEGQATTVSDIPNLGLLSVINRSLVKQNISAVQVANISPNPFFFPYRAVVGDKDVFADVASSSGDWRSYSDARVGFAEILNQSTPNFSLPTMLLR